MMMLTCLCGRRFNGDALTRCPACKMTTAQVRLITPEQREEHKRLERERIAEERRRASQTAQEIEDERQRLKTEFVSEAMSRMERSITEGRTPALHTVHVMAAQYSIDGQLGGTPVNVMPWEAMGWDGWEVVAAFPRTTGSALNNLVGNRAVYGGGIGGLVDGVHLVLRLPITARLLEQRREFVEQILSTIYEGGTGEHGSFVRPVLPVGVLSNEPTVTGMSAAASGGAFIGFGITQTFSSESEEQDSGAEGGGDSGSFDF
jgi:hypothetical protein